MRVPWLNLQTKNANRPISKVFPLPRCRRRRSPRRPSSPPPPPLGPCYQCEATLGKSGNRGCKKNEKAGSTNCFCWASNNCCSPFTDPSTFVGPSTSVSAQTLMLMHRLWVQERQNPCNERCACYGSIGRKNPVFSFSSILFCIASTWA